MTLPAARGNSYLAIATLIAALATAPVHSDEKTEEAKGTVPETAAPEATAPTPEEAAAAATGAVQGALPPEFTDAFPVGREFVGVSVPSYEGERLKTVMNAESITRIDERTFDIVQLEISLFGTSGEAETVIHMDAAAYDLVTQELVSKTPAKIEQTKFTMTGEKMIFDTRSQVSRLVGNVVVTIPDSGNLFPTSFLPVRPSGP